MGWGKASIKYALKAYFGGCFGCLGALSAIAALVLLLALTLGPKALGALQEIHLPSIPIMPLTPIPSGPGAAPSGEDCYETIDAWVSRSELGPPATTFSRTEGIFPIVESPADCGQVNAKLLDSSGRIIMERTYHIRRGRNSYGDFNPSRDLSPGSYKMQFWHDEKLLKAVSLTVKQE